MILSHHALPCERISPTAQGYFSLIYHCVADAVEQLCILFRWGRDGEGESDEEAI